MCGIRLSLASDRRCYSARLRQDRPDAGEPRVSIGANAATLSGLPVPPASDRANPAIWLAVRSFDRCRLRGEPSATGET